MGSKLNIVKSRVGLEIASPSLEGRAVLEIDYMMMVNAVPQDISAPIS